MKFQKKIFKTTKNISKTTKIKNEYETWGNNFKNNFRLKGRNK